jgi:preprotein translocase subunit SecG
VYSVLADTTMVLHFAFLVFLVIGGFLAWRWPRVIYGHLAVVVWGILITAFSIDCPLTGPEDYFRRQAGEEGLGAEGFIDTYLTGVIYPEEHLNLVRAAVAFVVLVSWIGFAVLSRRRARARKAAQAAQAPEESQAPQAPQAPQASGR